ncbi:Hypothetical predicted protein [Mytilus galloprovincialis]|uniref:Uncharacterized protein n=1 Tax=Mytilus galloprovincialis TaxID=29158 RepID=A0A8B6H193_MYTGA|nr:Hypothetical predicted protein [Mytilus galloprovincialis]
MYSATSIPTASDDEMVSTENEEQTSTMSEVGDFVQPEIEDPEPSLQLILDVKIHLVDDMMTAKKIRQKVHDISLLGDITDVEVNECDRLFSFDASPMYTYS